MTEVEKRVAEEWLDAFNTRNLPKLLALYAENAVHKSPAAAILKPETNGVLRGKPALEEWWGDSFKRLPILEYRRERIIVAPPIVVIQYIRLVPGDTPAQIAETLEIQKGLIVESRVYRGLEGQL